MKTLERTPEPQTAPPVTRQWWERWSPTVVGAVLAGVLGVWLTRGAWGGRWPAGEDVPAHLGRFDFGISQLVAHGRLDGWLPKFYVGYQEFLFQGPGLTWAVAAVRGVTFGVLTNPGGIKVIGVLSYAGVAVATAFLARSLGLGRLAAGIAAVLALLVSNPVGLGLQAIYLWGLLPNQLGAVVFCVTLGALLRIPVDPRRRWIILGGVSLAALMVTHFISLIVLSVFFPLLALGAGRRLFRREALTRLALAFGLAAVLAGWWLIPVLAHGDIRGPAAAWPTPPFGDRVHAIVDGRILFRPYTFWLVVAGWMYALTRWRRTRFAVAIVLVPIAYLVVAHWAVSARANEYTLQLANRGLGYAGLIAILPLATLLAGAARYARRLLRERAWATPAIAGGALALACVIVLSPLGPRASWASQINEASPQMRHAAAVLRRAVPDGARFAVRRDLGELLEVNALAPEGRRGHPQPPWWLARQSGRDVLNGFGIESSSTPSPNVEADGFALGVDDDAEADFFARVGVTHVVTMTDAMADHRLGSARYELLWRQSPLAVFAVHPRPGHPEPASQVSTAVPATARLARAEPERLRIDVDATQATEAEVALAWSPKWHATVNDHAARLDRTPDGRILVHLPAGVSRLELAYRPDVWDRIGVALSAITVLALLALGGLWWYRRRQDRAAVIR